MTSLIQNKKAFCLEDMLTDKKGAPGHVSAQLFTRTLHSDRDVAMPSLPIIPERVSMCSLLPDLPLPFFGQTFAVDEEVVEQSSLFITPPSSPKKIVPETYLTPDRARLLRNPLPKDTPSRAIYPQESRPLWWNAAYRAIRDLSSLNRSSAISSQTEILEKVIEEVKASKNPKEHLMLLKLFSEFMFHGASDFFFDVLRSTTKLVFELNEFLFEDPYGEPEDGLMISTSGMEKVIKYFEAQFSYPPGVLSCLNVSSLPQCILDLTSQGKSGECRGWVVSNDLEMGDPHVVPVFAQEIDGLVHVFIFDSLGHGASVSASLEHLIKVFKDNPSACSKVVLHSYVNKRQNSPLVCWVFSLLDLKALLERSFFRPESLLHFYQAQKGDLAPQPIGSDLKAGDLRVFALKTLPPEMMKSTQSLTEIGRYSESSIEWDGTMASSSARYSFDGSEVREIQDFDSMLAKVENCSRLSPTKRVQNLYVERKRLTYMIYLICSVLGINPADSRGSFATSSPDSLHRRAACGDRK